MEQDGESERIYWAHYDRLHKCRRWNSLLAQLRKLAWFAWGAWIALSVDTLIRDRTAAWLLWSGAVVFFYTILVNSLLKPDLEEEVARWLRMVRLKGFDARGDIEDVLIPYMEAERLVEEGWLRRAGEGWYKPHDCGWDVLLGTNARGWRRSHYPD